MLDGTFAGPGVDGLVIQSSDNFVRGIAIRNFDSHGIEILDGDWNRIGGEGGCDQPARQNVYTDNGGYGVHIAGGELNFIWQSDIGRSGEGNALGGVLIDGDALYTRLVGDCVRIVGNDGPGLHIAGSATAELYAGGTVYTTGNTGPGVWLDGAGGNDNFFQDLRSSANGSHGIQVDGETTRFGIFGQITGNGGDGIHVDGASFIQFINGRIQDNAGAGVRVVSGSGVRVLNNNVTVSGNGGLGIDLGPLGVTVNDAGDGDSGPNDLLNYPEITSVVGAGPGQTDVIGKACPGCTVWVWRVIADPSGHGEGSTMGSGNANGSGDFSVRVYDLALGEKVTAVAIRESDWAMSEFAANVAGPRGPLIVDRADDADVRICDDVAPNDCTLRGALNEVGAGGTIHFSTSVFPTPGSALAATEIAVQGALPAITKGFVVIDAGPGSLPRVILDGSAAGAGVSGLVMQSDWNRVRGLFIRDFDGDGIRVASGALNWIGSESCWSGGPNVLANNGGAGVRVLGGTGGVNLLGMYVGVLPDGTAAGNGEAGIVIEDGGNYARGNGTCMRIAYNHGPGVVVGVAQDVYFDGESNPGQMLIDHNDGPGVVFDGSLGGAVMKAQIVDNEGDGVRVVGGANQIVITSNAEIQRNRGAGVRVVDGQRVLLGPVRIFGNDDLSFDLVAPGDVDDGVTTNDGPDDLDDGPNGLLNKPVITTIEGAGAGNVRVKGTACAGCRVWLYQVTADPSGFGGMNGNPAWTDADGSGNFDGQYFGLPEGASITALATRDTYFMSEP